MLVLPGLSTEVPAVVTHLETGRQRYVGRTMLKKNLHAHLRRSL